jgi:hydrogenase maturation protease
LRVLVGGIGYRNLRDHSIGVSVSDHLMELPATEGVLVEDASYNPIALVQRLETGPVDRLVLVAGVHRGRAPGAIGYYRWDGKLPNAERIQEAVAEAVTGVIALDNTLMVGGHFGAFPEDVVVVEVEPVLEEFGDELSPEVGRRFESLCGLVMTLATRPEGSDLPPLAPLGGGDTLRMA